MSLLLAAPAGARPARGLVHLLIDDHTACGHVPGATWTAALWSPPTGCCKTCIRTL